MRTLAGSTLLVLALALGGCRSKEAQADNSGCSRCPDNCLCDHCQGVAGATVCDCEKLGYHPGVDKKPAVKVKETGSK
jgi:hypothetical protein